MGFDLGNGDTVTAADGIERLAHLDQVVDILAGNARQRGGEIIHLREDLLGRGLVHLGLPDEQLLPGTQMRRIEPRVVLNERIERQRIAFGNGIGGFTRLHGMGNERPLHFAARQLHRRYVGTENPHLFARLEAVRPDRRIVLVKPLLGNAVKLRERIDRFTRSYRMQVVVGTGHVHHFGRLHARSLGNGLSQQQEGDRENHQPIFHHRTSLTSPQPTGHTRSARQRARANAVRRENRILAIFSSTPHPAGVSR